MDSKKDFDKAMVVADHGDHIVALIGKSTDEGPSGVGVFERRPMQEGKPLMADCFASRQEDGSYNITHLPRNKEGKAGPAQVATPAYRNNYDRIFGNKYDVN